MDDNSIRRKQILANVKKYEEARQTGASIFFDVDELMDIADYYNMRGLFSQVSNVLQYAHSLAPQAAAPMAFMARMALFNEHNIDKAKAIADSIVDKMDVEYYYIVAEIMLWERKPDEADSYLTARATEVDEFEDFVLDVALLFADYNCYELAQKWLDDSDETDEPDYREVKARIDFSQGRFEEGKGILERLIDEEPYNNHYWNILSQAQLAAGEVKQSMESVDYALAISPHDADALLNRANVLYDLGNYADAVEAMGKYLKIQPNNTTALMSQANALMMLDRYEEALIVLQHAYSVCEEMDDNYPSVIYQLVFCLAALGQYDRAGQLVEKLASAAADGDSIAYILRGFLYLQQGDVKGATQALSDAIVTSKGDLSTYYRIAMMLYDSGHYQMAFNVLERQAEERSEEEMLHAYVFLTLCAYELGLHEKFLVYLEKTCRLDPLNAFTYLHDLFPDGMAPSDYYAYAKNHPLEMMSRDIDAPDQEF